MLRPIPLCTLLLVTAALQAQHQPVVINSYNPGAITVPGGDDWKVDYTNVYDDGTRPVLQLSDEKTGITASIILFDNYYKKVTPEGCRKDATDGILQNQAAAITDRKDSASKDADGTPLALTFWNIHGKPADDPSAQSFRLCLRRDNLLRDPCVEDREGSVCRCRTPQSAR